MTQNTTPVADDKELSLFNDHTSVTLYEDDDRDIWFCISDNGEVEIHSEDKYECSAEILIISFDQLEPMYQMAKTMREHYQQQGK